MLSFARQKSQNWIWKLDYVWNRMNRIKKFFRFVFKNNLLTLAPLQDVIVLFMFTQNKVCLCRTVYKIGSTIHSGAEQDTNFLCQQAFTTEMRQWNEWFHSSSQSKCLIKKRRKHVGLRLVIKFKKFTLNVSQTRHLFQQQKKKVELLSKNKNRFMNKFIECFVCRIRTNLRYYSISIVLTNSFSMFIALHQKYQIVHGLLCVHLIYTRQYLRTNP